MKYCDLFCGLGGFSLAAHNVFGNKAECVFALDFDKNVAKTYKTNFNIDCLGDIREIDAALIPDHDILFGGFPCQPFSRNGKWFNKNDKTIGTAETRDNLFLEVARILAEKQPKFFLLENVKGLLSMKNTDGSLYYDAIIHILEVCGYNVKTQVLDAADFGLPQQRKRVFFVGTRDDIDATFEFPSRKPRITSISNVLETTVDDKYLLVNLWKNRKITSGASRMGSAQANHPFAAGSSRYEAIKYIHEQSIKLISPISRIHTTAIVYGDTPSGLPRQQDKIYSTLGISPTIATFSTPSIDAKEGLRQLTPRECARLQGIPDSYILPTNDGIAYKQIGNSVAVPVITALIENIVQATTTSYAVMTKVM